MAAPEATEGDTGASTEPSPGTAAPDPPAQEDAEKTTPSSPVDAEAAVEAEAEAAPAVLSKAEKKRLEKEDKARKKNEAKLEKKRSKEELKRQKEEAKLEKKRSKEELKRQKEEAKLEKKRSKEALKEEKRRQKQASKSKRASLVSQSSALDDITEEAQEQNTDTTKQDSAAGADAEPEPPADESAILHNSGIIHVEVRPTLVEDLTEEEHQEIRQVLEGPYGHYFPQAELERLYIGYKDNNKSITREDFLIIYLSFSKLGNRPLANAVFDLFDDKHAGSFQFDQFVHFLGVMTKGDSKEKATLCFQLYDRDHDGQLSRQDLIDLLSRLPIPKMLATKKSLEALKGMPEVGLDAVLEEEEESEAAERRHDEEAMQHVNEEIQRMETLKKKRADSDIAHALVIKSKSQEELDKIGLSPPPAQPAETGRSSPQPTKRDILRARNVVDEVFSEISHERESITLEEFLAGMDSSESLETFFPF